MACAANCPTQDHKTYGECLRGKHLRVGYCRSASGEGGDYTAQKRHDAELATFRQAVAEGHSPESTRLVDSLTAIEYGNRTGQAWQPKSEPVLTGADARGVLQQ